MIAVARGLLKDWVYYLSVVSGAGAVWTGVYFKYIRPLRKEHEAHEDKARKEREAVYNFVLGMPADGLRPEVVAAPIQLKKLSDNVGVLTTTVHEAKASNERVSNEVSQLAQTMVGLDGKVTKILSGTATLVHESKTNDGGSMRDAVDEIVAEQARVRIEKDAEK